jgi:protease-4
MINTLFAPMLQWAKQHVIRAGLQGEFIAMSNLPPSKMPTLGDDDPRDYQPPDNHQSPTSQPPPSRFRQYFGDPVDPNKLPPSSRFSPSSSRFGRSGRTFGFDKRPPAPPPRGNDRTILWVIMAMLMGFFAPICAIALLCSVSVFALNQLFGDFAAGDTGSGPAIGIIELEGVIYNGDGPGASEGNMRAQLEWMEKNKDVKAIVIRANSPGGDANASDEIWQAVKGIRKPVIVSVQGLCASGCLYIASGADEIMATRNSLVGSIGVISTFFNAEALLEKIGVEANVIATGESKDFGSIFRDMTPEEEAYWRTQLEDVLAHFIDVVANRPGSTLSVADVRELATGEVWSAQIALNHGLVDSIGYEDDAVERAAQLVNLRDYRVVEYPFNFSFSDLFVQAAELQPESIFNVPSAEELLDKMQQPSLQYRYLGPYNSGPIKD